MIYELRIVETVTVKFSVRFMKFRCLKQQCENDCLIQDIRVVETV